MNTIEAMRQWVLVSGTDDWVSMFEIEGQAKYLEVPEECRIDQICQVITELADSQMVEIGSVTKGGFTPWSCSIDESIAKIRTKYSGVDDLNWGFSAWLNSLPKGIEAGEKYLVEDSEYSHLWRNEDD